MYIYICIYRYRAYIHMCTYIYTKHTNAYIYIYTYIHCNPLWHSYLYMCEYTLLRTFPSLNVSNALFLTIRGRQQFRTPCPKHVFPAAMLRTTRSQRIEDANRLRTARSKRCVAMSVALEMQRSVSNALFATY